MSYGQGPLNSQAHPAAGATGLWEFDNGLYGGILLCVLNVVRMRKAPAFYKKVFCYV